MKLPAVVKGIRSQLLAAFPPPFGLAASSAKEELFRLWCIRFAEQVAFALPGQGWGMKKASNTRPISKDTLTQKQPDGSLLVWDLFGGVGTNATTVVGDPTAMVITDQVFVEVAAINHLGDVPPPAEPPAEPPVEEPPTIDLDALFAEKLAPIEARLEVIEAHLAEPPAPPPAPPLYATFKIFGKTIRIPIK